MAQIINFNQVKNKKQDTTVDTLIDLDNHMADQVALKLVKHLACTTTAEDIDPNRLMYILDEVVHQINTKYI